jgi:hypothetical protein
MPARLNHKLSRPSIWSGHHQPRCAGPSTGVQVTQSLGLEGPGARLGRLSPRRLGSCQGRFQVGSDLGHDLLGTADPRLPATFAAGATLAALGSARGPDGDLVPGNLLVDRDGHGHLQSVGDGRSYPLGTPITKLPAWVEDVVRRDRLDHDTASASGDRRARPKGARPAVIRRPGGEGPHPARVGISVRTCAGHVGFAAGGALHTRPGRCTPQRCYGPAEASCSSRRNRVSSLARCPRWVGCSNSARMAPATVPARSVTSASSRVGSGRRAGGR